MAYMNNILGRTAHFATLFTVMFAIQPVQGGTHVSNQDMCRDSSIKIYDRVVLSLFKGIAKSAQEKSCEIREQIRTEYLRHDQKHLEEKVEDIEYRKVTKEPGPADQFRTSVKGSKDDLLMKVYPTTKSTQNQTSIETLNRFTTISNQ